MLSKGFGKLAEKFFPFRCGFEGFFGGIGHVGEHLGAKNFWSTIFAQMFNITPLLTPEWFRKYSITVTH